MKIHKNARLTPLRREVVPQSVIALRLTMSEAAGFYGVCAKIVARWVGRYKKEELQDMLDRSSRPHRLHGPIDANLVETTIVLRRQHLCGKHIAVQVGVSTATVRQVLHIVGLSRLADLEPVQLVRRSVREHPGE